MSQPTKKERIEVIDLTDSAVKQETADSKCDNTKKQQDVMMVYDFILKTINDGPYKSNPNTFLEQVGFATIEELKLFNLKWLCEFAFVTKQKKFDMLLVFKKMIDKRELMFYDIPFYPSIIQEDPFEISGFVLNRIGEWNFF